ncbi:MAG: hypothetical protein K0Q81_1919 [Paenibacillus sp.]|jgi:hypothetical protein|nr:hypothetical protein [Paenibacillus sp.]
MQVKFIDVGRNNKSWEAECNGELTYKFLYGQVKKNGDVVSSGLDFTDDGAILAGFRTIGRFEVLE